MSKLTLPSIAFAFGVAGLACGGDIAEEGTAGLVEQASCNCPDVYAPVCGEDGVTYGNACVAECAGVKVAYEGPCRCVCPDVYDPVCGEDGVTYGNACVAECAGVKVAYEGPCKVGFRPR